MGGSTPYPHFTDEDVDTLWDKDAASGASAVLSTEVWVCPQQGPLWAQGQQACTESLAGTGLYLANSHPVSTLQEGLDPEPNQHRPLDQPMEALTA